MMSCACMWDEGETKHCMAIWAGGYVREQLEHNHKKIETFKMFRHKLIKKGFQRTTEQCHIKVSPGM